MATKTLPRLSDFAPAGGSRTRMVDIADRDLRLVACEPRETQFGRGYLMTLVDPKGDDAYEVLTSAVVVVAQLDKLMESDPFQECLVRFEKPGQAWIIV